MKFKAIFRSNIAKFLIQGDPRLLQNWKERDWKQNLRWLDRSGLALPLAAKLRCHQGSQAIPSSVMAARSRRISDTATRMEQMFHLFSEANSALAESGIEYCCVKGFSLIGDCFEDISERHQIDLDFLVTPDGVAGATTALESLGYQLLENRASGESRFMRPTDKHIGMNAWLYDPPECVAIELHTSAWEAEGDAVAFPAFPSFLAETEERRLNDTAYPSLKPSRQFVYLVLHVFRHLTGSWVRLISFYELARIVRQRFEERSTWDEVATLVSEPHVASAFTLVLALLEHLFDLTLPERLQRLRGSSLSAESAIWISLFADDWLFTEPPGDKLALLVQRQFCPDEQAWREYVRRRLLPFRGVPSLSDAVATGRNFSYDFENLVYRVSRLWHHASANRQYWAAKRKWDNAWRLSPTARASHLVADPPS